MYAQTFPGAAVAPEAEESGPELAPHLASLSAGQWAAWRTVGLRGAGFPAVGVLRLAAQECARLADEILAAGGAVREARQMALEAVNAALDALRSEGHRDEDDGRRRALLDALHRLKKGKVPDLPPPGDAWREAVECLRDTVARHASLSARLRPAYDAASIRTSEEIHEALRDDRFREAVVWQNRHAWNTGMVSLLRNPPGATPRSSRYRQNEELVASYLQRYCIKNDTIGFFGPVGWASVVPQGPALSVEPGEALLASRAVYFEGWGIDALAAVAASDARLRPWLAPRPMPFNILEGSTLHLPGGGTLELPAKQAAVLGACDGRQPARRIAAALLREHSPAFAGEDEVYEVLELLVGAGLVAWKLDIPYRRRPDRRYRELLEAVGDESVRRPALEALAELEAARAAVQAAAGDAERLDRALGELEQTFMRLAGAGATRAAGQTYAARTLVYEDCRRDVEVNLGPELWQEMREPLSLLLTSARWLTFEVARMYRRAFQEIYAELSKKAGSPVVSAVDFWMRADPIMYREGTRIADKVVPLFQRRWAQVLRLPEGERRVAYSSAELRPRVELAFAAPRPGWIHARYHSPDVMIAASGPDAVLRGDYQLVIGEIHLATNNLNALLFLAQHPRPEEVCRAIEADFPEPRIVPLPPKEWANLTLRTSFGFVPSQDYRLEIARDTKGADGGRPLGIGSLVVEKTEEGLVLRSRDGAVRFDLVDALGEFLSNLVMNHFTILPPGEHTPRVTVDRVVISRETWRFRPQELEFAFEADPASRFLAAREWMRRCGLPRFVFARSPVERKPIYVDLDSPVLVNLFAKLVRRTGETSSPDALVTVSEMLPAHDQTWLVDAEGSHYASELRMVAVDLAR